VIHVPSARIFWVLWIVVTAWLLACAFLVNGEYGDGYMTIANSRYFFGDNPSYYLHRGPLAAIMLWPVEALVELLDVGPFEVTPYHLYSAVLHSVYLLGCWWALRSMGGQPHGQNPGLCHGHYDSGVLLLLPVLEPRHPAGTALEVTGVIVDTICRADSCIYR
jgi:hypothetical protein